MLRYVFSLSIGYFVLYQNLLFQFKSDKLDKAPCGMALLEGSYCEKTLVLRTSRDTRTAPQHDHCFTICYLPKRKKYYELRADNEETCDDWVAAIRCARLLRHTSEHYAGTIAKKHFIGKWLIKHFLSREFKVHFPSKSSQKISDQLNSEFKICDHMFAKSPDQ
ncbi:hypothetical protein ACTXT7_003649 [Hymenolepis weldensis]